MNETTSHLLNERIYDKVEAALAADQKVTERESLIDHLLVRIHFIVMRVRWTGLAPWECEFPFPGSLISTFLG